MTAWVAGTIVPAPSCGCCRHRHRDQLGKFPEVLGGGGEEELVLRSIWPPQTQAIQLQDALRCANSISTFFRWLREVT